MTEAATVYLNHKQTCARFGGVSHMWIRRRQLRDGFPLPVFMGRQKFWRIADLEAWEKSQADKPAPGRPDNLPWKGVAA